MQKVFVGMMLLAMVLTVSGCAQKSESEQLRDDMKKAGNQLSKDIDNLVK